MKVFVFLFALLVACNAKGVEIHVKYTSDIRTGTPAPSPYASQFAIESDLVVSFDDSNLYDYVMHFSNPKLFVANGKIPVSGPSLNGTYIPFPKSMEKYFVTPFLVSYHPVTSLTQNIATQQNDDEPVWSLNIKKSIASIIQIDHSILLNSVKQVTSEPISFHVTENSTYGEVSVSHTLYPLENKVYQLVKFFEPKSAKGYETKSYSNMEASPCRKGMESDDNYTYDMYRKYYFVPNERFGEITSRIESSGKFYIYPFRDTGEHHYVSVSQTFDIVKFDETDLKFKLDDFSVKHNLKYEQNDKSEASILEEITYHLTESELFSKYTENVEICKAVINKLAENSTDTSVLTYATSKFKFFTYEDLSKCFDTIKDDSEKIDLFIEILGVSETNTIARFVVHLLKDGPLNRKQSIEIVSLFGHNNLYPTVELIKELEVLIDPNFPHKASVRDLVILNYASLIYRAYKNHPEDAGIEKYIKIYYSNLQAAKTYVEQMIWINGLRNLEIGSTWKLILPIIRGDQVLTLKYDHYLRMHAIWASASFMADHQTEFNDVLWPIIINGKLNLELRVAAVRVYVGGIKSTADMTRLFWHMQHEKNPHLYNFYQTTIKYLTESTNHCNTIAEKYAIDEKPFLKNFGSMYSTSAFGYDQYNELYGIGGRIQGGFVANEKSNEIDTYFLQVDSYIMENMGNYLTVYAKFEGLPNYMEFFIKISENLDVDKIMEKFSNQKKADNTHVEITVAYNNRVIYTMCSNDKRSETEAPQEENTTKKPTEKSLTKKFFESQKITSYMNMFKFDQIFVNDFGLPTIFYVDSPALWKLESEHKISLSMAMNLKFNFQFRIAGTYGLKTYVPFSSTWHGIEREIFYMDNIPFEINASLNEEKNIVLEFDWNNFVDNKLSFATFVNTKTFVAHKTDKKFAEKLSNSPTKVLVTQGDEKLIQRDDETKTFIEIGLDFEETTECEVRAKDSTSFTTSFWNMYSNELSQILKVPFPEFYINYFNYIMVQLLSPNVISCQRSISIGPSKEHPVDSITIVPDLYGSVESPSTGKISKSEYLFNSTVSIKTPDTKRSREWYLEMKVTSEDGDYFNEVEFKGTRFVKYQPNQIVCFGWEKEMDRASASGNFYFNYGESYEKDCVGDDFYVAINWDAHTSDEQDQNALDKYTTYKECLSNSDFLSFENLLSYECAYAHTTLRDYTYNVKYYNVPDDVEEFFKELYTFATYTYEVYKDFDANEDIYNGFTVRINYPMAADKYYMNLDVLFPDGRTDFGEILYTNYIWPLQMINTDFSRFFSLHKYARLLTTCGLKSNKTRYLDGKFHEIELNKSGPEGGWSTLLEDNEEEDGNWGIYASKDSENVIRMKFKLNNSTIIVSPNGDKFLYQIDGQMYDYLHNIENFADLYHFKLFQALNSVVLILPQFTVYTVYNGHDIQIEFYKFDEQFKGLCV